MKCSLYMNVLMLCIVYTLRLVICCSFLLRKVFVQTSEGSAFY